MSVAHLLCIGVALLHVLSAVCVCVPQKDVLCNKKHTMKLVRFFNDDMASAVKQTIEVPPSLHHILAAP